MFEHLLKPYLLGGREVDTTAKNEGDSVQVISLLSTTPNVLERKGLNIPPDVKAVICKEIYDDVVAIHNQAKDIEAKIEAEKLKISEKEVDLKEFEKDIEVIKPKKVNTKSK